MGFFSGLKKAIKGIFKGIKKIFKKIVSSKIGKILLVAATVYFGGAALGYWNSPFQAINGSLSGLPGIGAGEAVTATQAAEAGGTLAASGGTSTAVADIGASMVPEAIGGTGTNVVGANSGLIATEAAKTGALAETVGAAGTVAPSASGFIGGETVNGVPVTNLSQSAPAADTARIAASSAKPGFFDSPLAKYGAMQMGGQMLSSAFTPDQMEIDQERMRLEQQNEEWRQNFLAPNYNVGQVDLGISPSPGKMLLDSSGKPIYPVSGGGFIKNQVNRG